MSGFDDEWKEKIKNLIGKNQMENQKGENQKTKSHVTKRTFFSRQHNKNCVDFLWSILAFLFFHSLYFRTFFFPLFFLFFLSTFHSISIFIFIFFFSLFYYYFLFCFIPFVCFLRFFSPFYISSLDLKFFFVYCFFCCF